ncbi:MAG: HipA domain-containing protein [Alphaproteobacteria bacterium]|nr:HipA domain-containing protein [Alphaproteobacteria bacterium]
MPSDFQKYSQFYKPPETEQKPGQIVDITGWSLGGDFDPYAEGTRSKFAVRCPSGEVYPFLIPEHRYLYKKAFERKKSGYIFHEQFWIEIIAYKIGRYLGIEVPPAFVACRTVPGAEQKEYACLIEWFHGYPQAPQARVDRGGDFMSLQIPDYDRDKGSQHNFETIIELFKDMGISDWQIKWARMLLLDCLIGNTDRHQENWEVISYFDQTGRYNIDLSPAFDNGTAMGYEVLAQKMPSKLQNLGAYIDKGTHHMRWGINDPRHVGHFELLQKLASTYPQTQPEMARILSQDPSPLCEDIKRLTEFDIQNPEYCLTPRRADFMTRLLTARHQRAQEAIGA